MSDVDTPSVQNSIKPTYDSRQAGNRYHVTYRINDETVTFQEPIPDPFVRATLRIGWRDLIRALVTRRSATVEVIVGGDVDVMNDVLELDGNTLIPGRLRRAAWDSHVNERLGSL